MQPRPLTPAEAETVRRLWLARVPAARIAQALGVGRDFLERRIKDCPALRDLPRRGRGFGGGRPRGGDSDPSPLEIARRAAAVRVLWTLDERVERGRCELVPSAGR
jgi:hypothetical protein